jgi:non-ribosomal peptide synthetase-like protein
VGLADIGFFAAVLGYLVVVERAVAPLAALRPGGVSIYHRDFWRHERYWKVPARGYEQMFNGTPFKPILLRAVGATIGSRVFDDGSTMPEKNFVTVGDDATLNLGACVQTHSQEDGAFKSNRTTIGPGATLGVHAFVHYGVTVGAGAVLGTDCFLMKGEEVPAHAFWAGNPAHDLPGRLDPAR